MKAIALLVFVALLGAVCSEMLDSSTRFPKLLYERYRQPWKLLQTAETETVDFWVALKQQNLDVLDKIVMAVSDPTSSEYGHYLSIDEILDIVAPPKQVQDQVEAWIKSAGGVRKIENHRDAFHVTMTGKAASRLFRTPFYVFQHETSGAKRVRQLYGFSIPETIRPLIDFVSGLTEFPYYSTHKKNVTLANPDDSYGFVIPQTVRNVYNIPQGTTVTNSNNKQGVIEFSPVGGPYFSDLQQFAQQAGEIFTNISHIVGPFQEGSNDGESVLDVELITNVAPKAVNWYWTFADGWAYEMALAIFNEPEAPYVNSVSYGWPEVYTCQSAITHANCTDLDSQTYVERANTEFQKVAVRGLSVLIATQDEGAPSEANEDCSQDSTNHPVYAIYPSSSPYVTGVSATTIEPSNLKGVTADPPICQGQYPCTHGTAEVPCETSNTYYQWTTGGGFSAYGKRPSYQTAAVQAFLQSGAMIPPSGKFPSGTRGYADVAAVGARILTWNYGSVQPSAGTSASTPIFSAVVTLLNDYRLNNGKKPLGFLNPLLYQIGQAAPSAFHDITTGSNQCTIGTCCQYGYGATKGWDPVSGWGTPNYQELLKYIKTLP